MYFYCLVFVIVLIVLLNFPNQRETVFLIPIWRVIVHLKYVKHSVIITIWEDFLEEGNNTNHKYMEEDRIRILVLVTLI